MLTTGQDEQTPPLVPGANLQYRKMAGAPLPAVQNTNEYTLLPGF